MMNPNTSRRMLALACVVALVALALIVWSIHDPRPLPVIGAMSIGQALGIGSLGLYVYAVLVDVRRDLLTRD